MTKILIFGVDGLDRGLLRKFGADIPCIQSLKNSGQEVRMNSVFPPDSNTAWASIYTGKNPANHGVVKFVDPLTKTSSLLSKEEDNRAIRGKTFWDVLSRYGKKVCLINPHLAYPVWPVNGIMTSRSSIKDEVQIFPEQLSREYDLNNLRGLKGVPNGRRDLEAYREKAEASIKKEAHLGLRVMTENQWDLFFIYFPEVDWIEHFFWSSYDIEDPNHIPNDPYEGTIKHFYSLVDSILGEFIRLAGEDTNIVLLSDHGHGRRPQKLINTNYALKNMGLLSSRIKRENCTELAFLVEKLKRYALKSVADFGLAGLASSVLKIMPSARQLYTTPFSIDWMKTLAYSSDLSGIKSYSYGGIIIDKEKVRIDQYECIRDNIIKEFSEIKDPESEEKLFNWIIRREDLYSGNYIIRYPDILFELKYGWGSGWRVDGAMFSTAEAHSIVPGSHKGDSAVFIAKTNRPLIKKSGIPTLMDIAPTILDLFGIKLEELDFDGNSLCA